MKSNIQKLREKCFTKYFEVDSGLVDIISGHLDYSYLLNPSISNIYQYLTDYVAVISEEIFGKKRGALSVLDWGAGKGNVTYLLRKCGFGTVVSCDIEGARDSFSSDTPIIKQLDINIIPLKHQWILPFESNSFDIVVSYGVLEHVPNDFESLNEISRILKPGGLFFCFHLPRKFSYIHFIARLMGDRYHDRLYTIGSCGALIKDANLVMLDIWERSILPKNRIKLFLNPGIVERIDLVISRYTPFKHLTTNVEFVAQKLPL